VIPRWAAPLAVAASLTTTACHTYTPVNAAPPGSAVRVLIPVRSAADDPNAAPQTRAIEGRVVQGGDTIVLATTTRQEYGAYREIIQYDTLRLAPEQRYSVEVKEFSSAKSIGLGVGLSALVVGVAIAAFGGETGDDGGIPPDPPPPAPAIVSSSLISAILGLLRGG